MIKITYTNDYNSSLRAFFVPKQVFYVRKFQPLEIKIGNHGSQAMTLAHEVAHAIHYACVEFPRPMIPRTMTAQQMFNQELTAWRIAKKILRHELWNEDEAIESLQSYETMDTTLVDWSRLQIIPFGKIEHKELNKYLEVLNDRV
jgi:hypothetical protein